MLFGQVLSDVKLKCHGLPFHDCTLNQLPVIVWSRLLNDLCPHLLCFRMSVDGAWLLQWKNRRLKEIAMERYLKSKQSLVESNQLIADYFSGKMAAERKVLGIKFLYIKTILFKHFFMFRARNYLWKFV